MDCLGNEFRKPVKGENNVVQASTSDDEERFNMYEGISQQSQDVLRLVGVSRLQNRR